MLDKDRVKQTKTSLGNICYENNKNKNNTLFTIKQLVSVTPF